MDVKEQIRNVEKVLNEFPIEYRKNYNKNKETLQIEYISNFQVAGRYDILLNKIILRESLSLEHELFHVATDNRKCFNTPINDQFNFGGGISYYRRDYVGPVYGLGLNEGFVQSLAERANMQARGVMFNTYIVNLLLSIYGDDLYCYPFTNDPVGFYNYCSNNINSLRSNLDIYHFCLKEYNIAKKNGSMDEINQKLNSIFLFIQLVIKDIIIEYNACVNPLINRNEMKNQIERLLDDKRFWEFQELLPIKSKIEKEIINIIHTELVSTRQIISEKSQKIKKFLHFS